MLLAWSEAIIRAEKLKSASRQSSVSDCVDWALREGTRLSSVITTTRFRMCFKRNKVFMMCHPFFRSSQVTHTRCKICGENSRMHCRVLSTSEDSVCDKVTEIEGFYKLWKRQASC